MLEHRDRVDEPSSRNTGPSGYAHTFFYQIDKGVILRKGFDPVCDVEYSCTYLTGSKNQQDSMVSAHAIRNVLSKNITPLIWVVKQSLKKSMSAMCLLRIVPASPTYVKLGVKEAAMITPKVAIWHHREIPVQLHPMRKHNQ